MNERPWELRLESISRGHDHQLIRFVDQLGTALHVRLSNEGRMISVVHGHRTLHSRKQRGKNSRRFRLRSEEARWFRDLALKAVAAHVLRGTCDGFPVQKMDDYG